MKQIAYKLSEAARVMSLPKATLEELRDEGHVITYRIGRREYVTDHMLRDLQHRLTVGELVVKKLRERR